jgi:hypothetical protein
MLTPRGDKLSSMDYPEKGIFKDTLQLWIFFGLAVYFVYFAPVILNKAYFGITLFLFYKSNKNHLWIAFCFLLMMAPGTVFKIVEATNHNIPKLGLGAGFNLGYFGLFILVAYVKALANKPKNVNSPFRKEYFNLILYLILLNIITLFYGFQLSLFVVYLKTFVTFTLFFSLPILLPSTSHWFKFTVLFSPFVLLVFISQIYNVVNGRLLINELLGISARHAESFGHVLNSSVKYRPTGFYPELQYLALLFSLLSLNLVRSQILRLSAIIVVVISSLSIVISATKSWILVYIVVLIGYLVTNNWSFHKTSRYSLVIAGAIIVVFSINPVIFDNLSYAMERFVVLQDYIKGDFSSEHRIQYRLDNVVDVASINPITGVGFSERFVSSNPNAGQMGEYHLGLLNLIANAGVIGVVLFLMLGIRLYQILMRVNTLHKHYTVKRTISILKLGFIGIIIINMTSYQLIGYTISNRNFFFLALFFSYVEVFITELNSQEKAGFELRK